MERNGEYFKEILTKVLMADPITVKGKDALSSMGIHISENEYLDTAI